MGDFIFVPALIGQVKNMYKGGVFWKDKPVISCSEDSIDYYPWVLASAWWEMEDDPFLKKRLKMPDDAILYGDSGGFQSLKKGVDLEVEKTLEWQENNCDRAMTFDHPPSITRVNNVSIPTTDSIFDKKMQETYDNNILALSLRDRGKSNVQHYNVMQGESLARRERWYNTMKDLPFEAVASAARPAGSSIVQALAMCHLHSKGYTGKLHVLGVGGNNVLPLFPYIKDWFEEITVDSSSYGQGVRVREYYIDTRKSVSMGNKIANAESAEFRDRIQVDGLECDCPTCKSIDKEEVSVLWAPGSMGGSLITSHNLRIVLRYVEMLNGIAEVLTKEEYKEYLQQQVLDGIKREELSLSLEFIDDYLENGIENTCRKYARILNIDGKKAIIQGNLFE